jgi:transposase-like protein
VVEVPGLWILEGESSGGETVIDWTTTWTRLGFASEEEMWADLYDRQKLSIADLAGRFGVSRNTIRLALGRRATAVRGRGGANRTARLPEDIVAQVKEKGVLAVAKSLGLSYTTLYKRLRKIGVSVADLRRPNDGDPAEGTPDAEVREQE